MKDIKPDDIITLLNKINPKEIVFAVLTMCVSIAAFWLWYKIMPLVAAGEFGTYKKFLLPFIALILASVFFAIAALFIRNHYLVYPALMIGSGAPYFFMPANIVSILTLILSVGGAFFAARHIRKEYLFSLSFSLTKTLKAGLPLYFTVASLIISVFFFSQLTEEKVISTLLPKSAFTLILEKMQGPLVSITGFSFPKISSKTTVDELLNGILQEQLKSQGLQISQLPAKELNALRQSFLLELNKKYGVKAGGKEGAIDLFYDTISRYLRVFLDPYKFYLPYASALAFFFAIKALTLPLYYISMIAAFLLIKILVFSKILRSEKQQIEVERLTL